MPASDVQFRPWNDHLSGLKESPKWRPCFKRMMGKPTPSFLWMFQEDYIYMYIYIYVRIYIYIANPGLGKGSRKSNKPQSPHFWFIIFLGLTSHKAATKMKWSLWKPPPFPPPWSHRVPKLLDPSPFEADLRHKREVERRMHPLTPEAPRVWTAWVRKGTIPVIHLDFLVQHVDFSRVKLFLRDVSWGAEVTYYSKLRFFGT